MKKEFPRFLSFYLGVYWPLVLPQIISASWARITAGTIQYMPAELQGGDALMAFALYALSLLPLVLGYGAHWLCRRHKNAVVRFLAIYLPYMAFLIPAAYVITAGMTGLGAVDGGLSGEAFQALVWEGVIVVLPVPCALALLWTLLVVGYLSTSEYWVEAKRPSQRIAASGDFNPLGD